ncbi:carnitine dehydratase [Oleiphilus sp. HI0081]|uniref:CaiB/BaiF CoA transferase family protein n=3 Tax=Oleiphilus TaxID=141450 RepID=UPI0007C29B9F|nr:MULTISPECIES: CaiB/BaiF CoA-transferase family protein [unclassified Oleiphilus]KZY84242.1 carnitine dehydratase [Oleiphilus sp. HI0069]KZY84280.1 carnitine dehydratase [Oleiphilus sp. HI0068]KZY87879.1 carnitine dehydratase [Oleiphilus sp. HI0072]KZZ25150.1 carnitine dehydratase [Oleiphilus sp. HI0081]KZY31105.1 carnitine dehydratase [Oleiphilus sp. HI0043]
MSQPLKGIKILDFTTLLPGPYATQLLADMGAEVVRVESPTRPDLLKLLPPMVGKVSASHASVNRNKKTIAVDLKHESAKEIVHKLVSEFDIVIEQFRPGVMARLGLDYEALVKFQSKLIYCSITGYGQTGPLKDRAGHDINYLALSGLASFSGRKETGPTLSATQVADIAGGSHHAVMAILAAVIERASTGKGQHLDISMSDAALALSTMFGANALVSGKDPACGEEMLNGGLFYDYYQTADGKYISVGSLEPNFAMVLLSTLGLTAYQNKIADQRAETQTEIKAAIAAKVIEKDQAHWNDVFGNLDACVEPVLSINQAAAHPHFIARGMITTAVDETGNEIQQINSALPFKSEGIKQAGRPLGADTSDVLKSLGYSDEQVQGLREGKCVK